MEIKNIKRKQIKNSFDNLVEKLKSLIRKGKEIPSAREVFSLFAQMLPFEINEDKLPELHHEMNDGKHHLEIFFYFESQKYYLSLKYWESEYRGRPLLMFTDECINLDLLDDIEDFDEEKMSYLKQKFNIEF